MLSYNYSGFTILRESTRIAVSSEFMPKATSFTKIGNYGHIHKLSQLYCSDVFSWPKMLC